MARLSRLNSRGRSQLSYRVTSTPRRREPQGRHPTELFRPWTTQTLLRLLIAAFVLLQLFLWGQPCSDDESSSSWWWDSWFCIPVADSSVVDEAWIPSPSPRHSLAAAPPTTKTISREDVEITTTSSPQPSFWLPRSVESTVSDYDERIRIDTVETDYPDDDNTTSLAPSVDPAASDTTNNNNNLLDTATLAPAVAPGKLRIVEEEEEWFRLTSSVMGHEEDGPVWSNRYNVVHVVTSRFQQHQPRLRHLGSARLDLFRNFALPSMQAQTTQEFLWVIFTDPDLHWELRRDLLDEVRHLPYTLVLANPNPPSSFRSYNYTVNVTDSSVWSGPLELLYSYRVAARSHIMVETRLDVDDALHCQFLETVQKQASVAFSSRTPSLPLSSRPSTYVVFCVRHHLEWKFFDPWNTTSQEGAIVEKVEKEGFCVTPGLTLAFSDRTVDSHQLPTIKHHELHRRIPPCTDTDWSNCRRDVAIVVNSTANNATNQTNHHNDTLPVFSAVRARTPTSDNLRGVQPETAQEFSPWQFQQAKGWKLFSSFFGIQHDALVQVRRRLALNLVAIVEDTVDGMCQEGFSECTEDKMDRIATMRELAAAVANETKELDAVQQALESVPPTSASLVTVRESISTIMVNATNNTVQPPHSIEYNFTSNTTNVMAPTGIVDNGINNTTNGTRPNGITENIAANATKTEQPSVIVDGIIAPNQTADIHLFDTVHAVNGSQPAVRMNITVHNSSLPVTNETIFETKWKNQLGIVHIVSSRYQQRQPDLLNLGVARLDLFKNFALASVKVQTTKDFLWVIFTDPNLHEELKRQLLQLVEGIPNAVILADRNTHRSLRSEWFEKLNATLVWSGSLDLVHDYYRAAKAHPLVETRLDVDDAIHRNLLHAVQLEAKKAFGKRSTASKPSYLVMCVRRHLEWKYFNPWESASSEGAIVDRIEKNGFCIAPGLTFAYSDKRIGREDLPTYRNHKIHELISACKKAGDTGCRRSIIVTRDNEFAAIRARTPTANNVMGVIPDTESVASSWKWTQKHGWSLAADQFGINHDELVATHARIHENLFAIVEDAEKGMCQIGFSDCSEAKKQRMATLRGAVGMKEMNQSHLAV